MRDIFKAALSGAGLALFLLIGSPVPPTQPARAEPVKSGGEREEILAVYEAFRQAQNARDPDAIGAFFTGGRDFLWVSDGRAYWGMEAVLARMGSFQKAEIWEVTPDLESARLVTLTEDSAMLHLPLVLTIGQAPEPDRLGFLVSILWVKEQGAWRIASLLTTRDNSAR